MLLDFEKPIAQLEEKLARMRQSIQSHQDNPDIIQAVDKLAQDIEALRTRTFKNLTRWQRVQLSRHPDRPHTLDYINSITDDFLEIHGDRTLGDDSAIIGGLASIGNKAVVIMGHQKGRTTKERQKHNFGMPNPEGYRKALRLMQLADKFNKPIITLIDTPGAYPGIQAEEHGQAEAIARNIQSMFSLKVPIISIIIGEGASGGALGLAIGDYVLMLEYTWYSVISPESCSTILWKKRDYKEQAAEILKLTAQDMYKFGLIDGIIKEPTGGAHRDIPRATQLVKENILACLQKLEKKSTKSLLQKRMEKFCAMGHVFDSTTQ